MIANSKRGAHALLIGIAYTGFIALGLSGGLMGVAWPSVRESFGISLDAIGLLLITSNIGYLLSSFVSGPLISRIGVGHFLMLSGVMAGVGLIGYSLSPAWWIMVLLGLVTGMGGGAVDAGTNTYFATNHSAVLMNWLHACFGLGATLGPVIMTAVLTRGHSWRWGYAIAAALQIVLALCFGFTRTRWRLGEPKSSPPSPDSPADKVSTGDTLRMPTMWFGIALFFMFTGIEATAGQWPYSLFTEARSVAPTVAGLWVSIYWGSLTLGRVVFGIVADHLEVTSLLRTCMLGVVLGAAGIWWNPIDGVSFLGLALMGFCLAPLFPMVTLRTPQRVGTAHAANAIGFQVAAAGLGFATLPGLAGVWAESLGLEIVGPFLLALSIVMFVMHEIIARR
jgi:fucose permease